MSENSLIRRVGNFLGDSTFPLDSDTLDALQNNQTLLAMLGNIFGDNPVILCGGEITGTEHNAGYAFVKTRTYPGGEILPFEGGSINGTLHLKAEIKEVSAAADTDSGTPPTTYNAYSVRSLSTTPGSTVESFNWGTFFSLKNSTIPQLRKEITANTKSIGLINNPVGTIHIWAGTTSNIPKGYYLCDGGRYDKYIDKDNTIKCPLYKAIGDTFKDEVNKYAPKNPETLSELQFRVPDLRGRFVVGVNPFDNSEKNKFNKIAITGGEKEHTLTEYQIPPHSHSITSAGDNSPDQGGGYIHGGQNLDNAVYYNDTSSSGGGQAHPNLPPYYVLSYIIKAE